MALLTPEEISCIEDARNFRNTLEAFEYAYDAAVRSIRKKKLVLEFLGFLVAIGLLYVLYAIKAAPLPQSGIKTGNIIHDYISMLGTGISLAVLIITIWGHMAKWDGQLEKKHELSQKAQELAGLYDGLVIQRPVPIDSIRDLSVKRRNFDDLRKHDLAALPGWAMQQAHQHIAMRYLDQKIKCNTCGRQWVPEFAMRRRWIKYIPFKACESCGV